jgi:diguanylate cyclase (GGDEF)-like protein
MQSKQHFSILLVDDDPMVIRILSRILAEFEPVRFATDGRMALKLATQSVPDLVLLDVDMPNLSGFDVCRAFKDNAALAPVPIIFISSHESPELEAKGLALGASDFLAKPPRAALVLARVRTHKQIKTLSDTLRSSVTMDFLTGAVTRRKLERSLAQEWLRAERSRQPLALLLVDIDDFPAYNAAAGEELGDACLRGVADALRASLRRPTDMLGRYAGGTFALLLPETDLQGASVPARRAIAAVDALRIASKVSSGRPCVTLSVGGACRSLGPPGNAAARLNSAGGPRPSDSIPDDLMAAAAQALKTARSAGGHQCVLVDLAEFDPTRTGTAAT